MNEDRYREAEQRLWAHAGLRPVERTVRLPRSGTDMRVQDVGEGPSLVFVHGGSSSGAVWMPLVRHLGHYRCVLVDRPGCGLSQDLGLDLRDLDRFATHGDGLVIEMLDALGVSSAGVVATSLGGHYALRAAAAHPERVARLLEFGYVPGAPLEHVPLSMRMAKIPGVRRAMTAIPPNRFAVRAILRQLGLGPALADGRLAPEFVDWFLALLRDTDTLANEMRLPLQLLAPGETDRALPAGLLGRISCPVRFVWSDTDPLGGGEAARIFVPRIEGAELDLWPDGSHAPWVDAPERAAAAVTDFFSDLA